ncbi:MAG TPA: hypothetical protein VN282_19810 [Pyrinomonadaceae bacterium]|nr:hypothetical protein [Pyrinomonadaceae bacterium]
MTQDLAPTQLFITTALKEYEALRKEIEARTDKTKTYGWPVILVALGAAASMKPDLLNLNLALMFVPAVPMTIAALAANANQDTDKARKAIALVEDRIYILSGKPLLCHHTMKLLRWEEKAPGRFRVAVFVTAAYLAGIIALGINLLPKINDIDASGAFLLYGVLLSPVSFFFYNSVKSYRLHLNPFRTLLLDALREGEDATYAKGRLVYQTTVSGREALEN